MRLPVLLTLAAVAVFLLGFPGCASDGTTPVVPQIPSLPTVDPVSCANLNSNVWKIEAVKYATGRYGEGEEERLGQLRLAAAVMGCFLEPFDPNSPPPGVAPIAPAPAPVDAGA